MTAGIYLDHQATTPLDPRVRDEMAQWLGGQYGHPASPHHAFGWGAEKALETARARVADLLAAEPQEIVFTSGGTEADNLAVRGAAEALHAQGRHLVASAVERSAVRDTLDLLSSRGFEVTLVGVDAQGLVDPDEVRASLREDTVLVSVQVANQETGTLQEMRHVAEICAERGIWVHADATAAAAWAPLDVGALGVHLLSITAHLMYGPMGIGALYVRRRSPRVRLAPLVVGGGTGERMRGGTPNLPGAVGLGRAAAICLEERTSDVQRVTALRDRLERRLVDDAGGVEILGAPGHRLANASALAVDGVEGEALVLGVPEVAFATGSACAGPGLESSHVLRAMGLSKETASTNVRFGLGRFTTEAEIDRALDLVLGGIERVRRAGRPR